MPADDPQANPPVIAEGPGFRMTFGPYERELAPPPLTPDLAAMLACIRDARERVEGMATRLERAIQATEAREQEPFKP